MDKIILKDKTAFEIAEGASLGNIQIQSKDDDDWWSADELARKSARRDW